MTNELQTKLDNILADKNTNLKPENLKAGVTCLGVEGTMKSKEEPLSLDFPETFTYDKDNDHTGFNVSITKELLDALTNGEFLLTGVFRYNYNINANGSLSILSFTDGSKCEIQFNMETWRNDYTTDDVLDFVIGYKYGNYADTIFRIPVSFVPSVLCETTLQLNDINGASFDGVTKEDITITNSEGESITDFKYEYSQIMVKLPEGEYTATITLFENEYTYTFVVESYEIGGTKYEFMNIMPILKKIGNVNAVWEKDEFNYSVITAKYTVECYDETSTLIETDDYYGFSINNIYLNLNTNSYKIKVNAPYFNEEILEFDNDSTYINTTVVLTPNGFETTSYNYAITLREAFTDKELAIDDNTFVSISYRDLEEPIELITNEHYVTCLLKYDQVVYIVVNKDGYTEYSTFVNKPIEDTVIIQHSIFTMNPSTNVVPDDALVGEIHHYEKFDVSNCNIAIRNGGLQVLADVTNTSGEIFPTTTIDIEIIDSSGNIIETLGGIIGEMQVDGSTQINTSTTSIYDLTNVYDYRIIMN